MPECGFYRYKNPDKTPDEVKKRIKTSSGCLFKKTGHTGAIAQETRTPKQSILTREGKIK